MTSIDARFGCCTEALIQKIIMHLGQRDLHIAGLCVRLGPLYNNAFPIQRPCFYTKDFIGQGLCAAKLCCYTEVLKMVHLEQQVRVHSDLT